MDEFEGVNTVPTSLHKYLYASANPVMFVDPSGYFSLGGTLSTIGNIGIMAGKTTLATWQTYNRAVFAYHAFQDVAMVISILSDGSVDDGESEILFELVQDYVRMAVRSYGFRIVGGAGGRALGAAAVQANRISRASIQRTRAWYRAHKARNPDRTVRTRSGHDVQIKNGFPDFSPYSQKTVTINLTGARSTDFDLADKTAGITKQWREQQGLVWHHHQKLGRMELVPRELNNPRDGGVWHAGGVKLYELLYDTTYGR